MAVTDAQVKKMRKELEKNGNLGRAAMKAGIDRKTARTYRDRGDLPSEAALLAAVLPNPIKRKAGKPSRRVRRIADVIQIRMRAMGPYLTCIGP